MSYASCESWESGESGCSISTLVSSERVLRVFSEWSGGSGSGDRV